MVKTSDRRIFLLICAFLVISTAIAFRQVGDCGFTHFDDSIYVFENEHIQSGLKLEEVIWAFTHRYEANWIPLTWISFMADYQFGGMESRVYHQTNLALHILNSVLLFAALTAMTGKMWRSGFVAALFALHPAHVESVAWVAERKDVLSTLFWILTMWTYAAYANRPGVGRYVLVAVLFALGLMSKSMLVTLPLVLLLLDLWPLGRYRNKSTARRLVIEKIPLLVMSVAVGIITVIAQRGGGSVATLTKYSLEARVENGLVSYVSYLWKLVWPSGLAFFYPHPEDALPVWKVVGAGLLVVALTAIAVQARKKRPYVTCGWLWYLITITPVIGFIQVGDQGMADRYTYIPFVGLFLIVAWGVPDLLDRLVLLNSRLKTALLAAPAAVILLGMMAVTQHLVKFWENDFTIFGRALAVTRNNFVAHYNLATSLLDQGETELAMKHYREVLRIKPDVAEAHINIGGILYMQGNYRGALEHFEKAVRIKPQDIDGQRNLATVLLELGRIDEAISRYREAIRVKPDDQRAREGLCDALDIQRSSH